MPTTRRDRTARGPRRARALTAVVALYALMLQALLGSIAALPVEGASGILCVGEAEGAWSASEHVTPQDHRPAPDAHHAAGCCTAASHAPATGLPPPAAGSLAWPERRAGPAGRIDRTLTAARPPPFTLAHARAPPAA